MARILFILKERNVKYLCDANGGEGTYSDGLLSSGLFNSARFVKEMLGTELGHETKLVHVVDNNKIDREVKEFRPDIVVIEAFWVVPEKFDVLFPLHKGVTWVVRNHSPTPFAATEGVILDWSLRYMDHPNVVISCNDPRAHREMRMLIRERKPEWSEADVDSRCVLLPNYYPMPPVPAHRPRPIGPILDVGCFGAVRPLKNQLIQAVAAIEFADKIGMPLRFHINGTRVEGKGEPILRNLQKMFDLIPNAELVEHPWMTHAQFSLLLAEMDIGLQVSYAESFNIVTADMVAAGVPVVTSSEVRWVHRCFHADPNSSLDIQQKMHRALRAHRWLGRWGVNPNRWGLNRYNAESVCRWGTYIDDVSKGMMPAA